MVVVFFCLKYVLKNGYTLIMHEQTIIGQPGEKKRNCKVKRGIYFRTLGNPAVPQAFQRRGVMPI
jgi:hypothetical protein